MSHVDVRCVQLRYLGLCHDPAFRRARRRAQVPNQAQTRKAQDQASARAELGNVSKMSWWRWERDARMLALGFPVAVTLCDKVSFSRRA
jgi:hypothetical protein